MEERIPPQDIDAEQSVLGSMMLSKDAIAQVIGKIKANYFYHFAHTKIFNALTQLYKKNEPVDFITVTNELKKMNALEEVGGRTYIAEILNTVPTASNALKYAEIVTEKALLRMLIDSGSDIIGEAFDPTQEIDDVLERAQKKIMDISREKVDDDFVLLKDILMPVLDSIHQAYDNEDRILGIPSGYKDLDEMTSGFQNGDLVILAARPSIGKTALTLNLAMNAAILHKTPVAIFSLEMPKEQLAMRMLCSQAKINSARLRTAQLVENEYRQLTDAMGKLSEAPIYIDDAPSISPLELRAKCRRLQIESDVKLIMIDYLQLMKGGKKKIESRFQEVSEIVREVKAFAKESGIPIIALSQLSRSIEQRTDKRPLLSDLRESGEIEQTADLVLFIHREDFYDYENNNNANGNSEAKIIIAKQRNGPTGEVNLMFKKEIGRFYNAVKANVPIME